MIVLSESILYTKKKVKNKQILNANFIIKKI